VFVAVSKGETCFADLDAAARDQIAWTRFEPDKEITPVFADLPDGVHHVLIKGATEAGLEFQCH